MTTTLQPLNNTIRMKNMVTNAFIWKAMQNRIPTLTNLRDRHVLKADEPVWCRSCREDKEENVEHIFFKCKHAVEIWDLMGNWLGVNFPVNGNIQDIVVNFSKMACGKARKVWQLFWNCTIWMLWRSRNEGIFQNGERNNREIFKRIKFNIWQWVKNKVPGFVPYDYTSWELCPLGVLSLVSLKLGLTD